jgi:hypothetical protein
MRLVGFGDIDLNLWKKCKFWEKTNSFIDVIRPDTINIIDYLELDDTFYKVAGILKDIHNKTKKGVREFL